MIVKAGGSFAALAEIVYIVVPPFLACSPSLTAHTVLTLTMMVVLCYGPIPRSIDAVCTPDKSRPESAPCLHNAMFDTNLVTNTETSEVRSGKHQETLWWHLLLARPLSLIGCMVHRFTPLFLVTPSRSDQCLPLYNLSPVAGDIKHVLRLINTTARTKPFVFRHSHTKHKLLSLAPKNL